MRHQEAIARADALKWRGFACAAAATVLGTYAWTHGQIVIWAINGIILLAAAGVVLTNIQIKTRLLKADKSP